MCEDISISKIIGNDREIVIEESTHTESKPCEWISTAIWEFIPTAGRYSMWMHASEGNSTGGETVSGRFNVIENIPEPDSNPSQIENIDGMLYYVSEPFMLNSSVDKIIFNDVEFSPPYRYDPLHYVYSDVIFSDGTEETLSILFDYTKFSEHVKPQAGLVETNDGIRFLVSIDLKELSPLKQFKLGISNDEIQCNEDHMLMVKPDRMSSPVCVFLNSVEKISERNFSLVFEFAFGE